MNKIEQEIARFEIMKEYFSCDFEKGLVMRIKKSGTRGKIGNVIKSKTGDGYIVLSFQGKRTLIHRFIFYCYHGTLYPLIDHKNTIRDDNKIKNLRVATHSQNMQNMIKPSSNNTTGYLGVSWNTKNEKYHAQINANGKVRHIGCFTCPIEAHKAYLAEKRQLHEFCTI